MDTEKHRAIAQNAPLFAKWITTRGGIAIWGCQDLGNPAQTWSTPLNREDGTPTAKPHWSATDAPIRVIQDADEVMVDTPSEVKRFRVGLERSGMGFNLTSAATRKVRTAVDKAGDNAWHEFDYTTQEAVIYVAGDTVSLAKWMEVANA